MNGSKYLLFFSFIFISNILVGQYKISGVVVDQSDKPLSYVLVNLKSANDSIGILNFTQSGDDGIFEFAVQQKEDYMLEFSDMNFRKRIISVAKAYFSSPVRLSIKLQPQERKLEEVVVTRKPAIMLRGDTVSFQLDSFRMGDERILEDILKKIPGVIVEPDGIIKVGDQEIEKIMVDGQDFFGKGYQMLSKNLPDHPLESLEILKHYQSNKLLKGITASNKVALNVNLKDNARNVWFGSANGAISFLSEFTYDYSISAMNFSKRNKTILFHTANTAGKNTAYISTWLNPKEEYAKLNSNEDVYTAINIGLQLPNLKTDRILFNSSKLLSLNNIYQFSKKGQLKVNGLLAQDKNDIDIVLEERLKLPQEELRNLEVERSRQGIKWGAFTMQGYLDLSEKANIESITNFRRGNEKKNASLFYNKDPLGEHASEDRQKLEQHFIFNKKLTDKDVLVLLMNYTGEQSNVLYNNSKYMFDGYFGEKEQINAVAENLVNKMDFFASSLSWKSRMIPNGTFDSELGFKIRNDRMENNLRLSDSSERETELDFNNIFGLYSHRIYSKSKFLLKANKLSVEPTVEFVFLHQNMSNELGGMRSNCFFVNPSVLLRYAFDEKNNLTVRSNYNITSSAIGDVYDIPLVVNFRSINIGENTLQHMPRFSQSLSYNHGNWLSKFHWGAMLTYTREFNYYGLFSDINQSYSVSQKKILHNKNTFNFVGNANYYLASIRTNIRLKSVMNDLRYLGQFNSAELKNVHLNNYLEGLEVRSGFDFPLNFNFGAELNLSKVQAPFRTQVSNWNGFLNFDYKISPVVRLKTLTDFYRFGGQTEKKIYFFQDVEIARQSKSQKVNLSLKAKNIFNNKAFKQVSVNELGISSRQFRLIPTRIFLEIEYKF